MQILNMKPKARTTPADAFARNYKFLLDWALHFVGEDRETAEDMVQETFVRFVLQQSEFDDDDPVAAKRILYTYLKHVHLSGLRQAQRHPFLNYSVSDFDTLQMGLRRPADPIEVQDSLRLIVAYLCWRKQSSKYASLLILRFFHGYFPEEIMKICILSRQSVDFGINAAREEVQLYLEEPSRLRIMNNDAPPEVHLSHTASDADHLMEELRATLSRARCTPCLKKEQLLQNYITENPKPIQTELLAHIVSCRECLDLVSRYYDMPTHSGRSPEESLGFAKRSGKSIKKDKSRAYGLKESLRMGEQRLREVFEHRPKVLLLLVNGEVVASQEVQSSVNRQTVGIRSCVASDFIEVITNQNVCLLSLAIDAVPPDCAPTMRQHVGLSDERSIDALVSFTSHGCIVEICYQDPMYHSGETREASILYERELGDGVSGLERGVDLGAVALPPAVIRPSRLPRLFSLLLDSVIPIRALGLGIALLLIIATSVTVFIRQQRSSGMTAADLLTRAESANQSSKIGTQKGVILQKVRIRTSKQTMDRSIYRDLQGKRHARKIPLQGQAVKLEAELTAAGVNWDDPLAATTYSDWRKQQGSSQDEVKRTGEDRLTLTTTVSAGPVSAETLTLRASDFHPIERTVKFRDTGLVEISELSYSILPWEEVGQDIFEPLLVKSPDLDPRLHFSDFPALHLRVPPTAGQLDEADLEVRLALTRLNAYTSERIEIVRRSDGVEVKGIVPTNARKHEIETKLKLVANVIPSLMTFQEMQDKQRDPRTAGPTTVITQSMETAEPSALQRFLSATGENDTTVSALAQELMGRSLEISRHSKALSDMTRQYGSGEGLTKDAKGALRMLLSDQTMKLLVALDREQSLLAQTYPHTRSPDPTVAPGSIDIAAEGEQNFQLCMNLTSGQDESQQSVPSLVTQIENNVVLLRHTAERNAADGLFPDRSFPAPKALNMQR
ncbi:RNA polymerase sigma factor [Granulicella sp. L60]|uniref:RNA polymerase sigma factor n=1 Tax=Granulicella sp. L60 TaxID=1641866 RepID=UPI00131E8D63|nr:RNA polymerase sigma factor [Granulicella sp. L60]